MSQLTQYIQIVMQQAHYQVSPEDGSIVGEIPGLDQVTAQAETLEHCRHKLVEALEEWIFFRVSRQLPLPEIEGHPPFGPIPENLY